MERNILERIEQQTGIDNLAGILAEKLSGSELNSLLMEVFNNIPQNISPARLLKQYRENRFVQPAGTDMIALLKAELQVLEKLREQGFQPIELSPLAQFGSCSVLGTVDQKKIVSAIRNTEVLADATNSIALHIASLSKGGSVGDMHFCTVHRHVRAQSLKEKEHTAHFKIGCMVSSGRDSGSYGFECGALLKHFRALNHLMRDIYGIKNIRFKLLTREGYPYPGLLLSALTEWFKTNAAGLSVSTGPAAPANNYYKGVQFKMIIEMDGHDIEIADGGFVDWTQQLLQNKKERLLISGFGFELLHKFQNKMA